MSQTILACCFTSYFYEKAKEMVLGGTSAADGPGWGIQSPREIRGF